MNGKGVYLWPNGEKLEGEWRDNKFAEGNYFNSEGQRINSKESGL